MHASSQVSTLHSGGTEQGFMSSGPGNNSFIPPESRREETRRDELYNMTENIIRLERGEGLQDPLR